MTKYCIIVGTVDIADAFTVGDAKLGECVLEQEFDDYETAHREALAIRKKLKNIVLKSILHEINAEEIEPMTELKTPYFADPNESREYHQARMHVKFMLTGTEGYRPGSFTQAMITALMHADPINFAKLRTVFPELAQAVETEVKNPRKAEVESSEEWVIDDEEKNEGHPGYPFEYDD